MENVSLVVQGCIGLIFLTYGICLLLSSRKKESKQGNKLVLSLVCFLVGIFLLGFVFIKLYKILV